MSKKNRIITLSVLSILIVVCVVLGITYSFMRANIDSSSVTEVSLSSCAKITLEDGGDAIVLDNSYPVSRNVGMQSDPYTFTVTSDCETYVGFNLYLATLSTNTLSDSAIHYVITEHGSKEALIEGILSEAEDALAEFNGDEQNQINIGINGTFGTIYKLYNESIPLQGSVTYDLYLFIDESVTNDTMNQVFSAGVAIKSYDREADPTLAEYIINNVYIEDGANDLYYHDGQGTYTNADQEAGDNSYRYSGDNPNNYVCFGTDVTPCPEDNLYRIIGVFDTSGEYQVKLIKNSSIGFFIWSSNSNTWDEATKPTIYSTLNDIYYNTLTIGWKNLISDYKWHVGGITLVDLLSSTKNVFNMELGTNQIGYEETMKIGLMYLSEFGYAASPKNWTELLYFHGNFIADNWMFNSIEEWSITPDNSALTDSYYINEDNLSRDSTRLEKQIRPTFYLNGDVQYYSGDGSIETPFILYCESCNQSTSIFNNRSLHLYIKNYVYTNDGENGLYYHDGVGTYTNADQEAEDNSYRYSGANPNNYICFGSNEEACPDDNLYRIIGIFDNEVKIIKNTSIGNYYWSGSSNNESVLWSNSSLNTQILNDEFIHNLGEYSNKISVHRWRTNSYIAVPNPTPKYIYYRFDEGVENIFVEQQIGLLYLSDFGYAASPENWTDMNSIMNNKENNWIVTGLEEWMINTVTSLAGDYGMVILPDGDYGGYQVNLRTSNVRPTFYLNSEVKYISGDGSKQNPFRIE